MQVSMVEIYNETVQDLLTSECKVLELHAVGNQIRIPDITEMVVESVKDVKAIMEMGDKNRSVAETKMNSTRWAIYTRGKAILEQIMPLCWGLCFSQMAMEIADAVVSCLCGSTYFLLLSQSTTSSLVYLQTGKSLSHPFAYYLCLPLPYSNMHSCLCQKVTVLTLWVTGI